MLKELVLQSLVPGIVASALKQGRVLGVVLRHGLHLLIVVSAGQRRQSVGVQLAAARV